MYNRHARKENAAPVAWRSTVASVGTTRCTPVGGDDAVAVRHVPLDDESIATLDVGSCDLYDNNTLMQFQLLHTGCNVEELKLCFHARLVSRVPGIAVASASAACRRKTVQMVA